MTVALISLAAWLVVSPALLLRLRRAGGSPSVADAALLWGWYALLYTVILAAAAERTWELGIWAPRISPVILFGGIGLIAAAISELIELGTLLKPAAALGESTWGGTFRYSRHPLYLGIIVTGVGVGLAGQSGFALATCGLYAVAFPIWAPAWERELELRFGASYSSYRKRTPLLLGRPKD